MLANLKGSVFIDPHEMSVGGLVGLYVSRDDTSLRLSGATAQDATSPSGR